MIFWEKLSIFTKRIPCTKTIKTLQNKWNSWSSLAFRIQPRWRLPGQFSKAPSPMRVRDSPKLMLAKEVQFAKAPLPICFTDSPKLMLAKEVHPSKARSPMPVTDSPKVMLAREVQFANAPPPISSTDSPKLMLAKEVQFAKAPLPTCFTDSPKRMLCKEGQFAKAPSRMWVIESPKVMLAREVQFRKAFSPMCVTESPKVMLPREVQFRKALSPMCVTDSPKATLAKQVQFWKARSPMWVTESVMVTETRFSHVANALQEIVVQSWGMVRWKNPHVWTSAPVAASTSFLLYTTVATSSASNNPVMTSSWESSISMIESFWISSTLRIKRSIGSSPPWCFSRRMVFNSPRVVSNRTSRVMTPPCKVFNSSSRDMAEDKEPAFWNSDLDYKISSQECLRWEVSWTAIFLVISQVLQAVIHFMLFNCSFGPRRQARFFLRQKKTLWDFLRFQFHQLNNLTKKKQKHHQQIQKPNYSV